MQYIETLSLNITCKTTIEQDFDCPLFAELHGRSTILHPQIVLNNPNNPILNQATPKNHGMENLKSPQKSFNHTHVLKT